MSVFLIATIEVRASLFGPFTEAMGTLQAIVESAGWKLASAYVLRTGQLNTVIDVWELNDHNHMNAGFAAVGMDPRAAGIQGVLQDAIIKETLTFADAISYPKPT
ncbi:hypothetical protein [Phenylobacterium sp.]|uniref:hypothetical protein n=1 Tax=Phenylobacterium sp. TaxID=1871053 RepID=UPI0025EC174D|nr:hypothetical protein [Phenylobacterium sp.]